MSIRHAQAERSHSSRAIVSWAAAIVAIGICGWEMAAGSYILLLAALAIVVIVVQFKRRIAGLETIMLAMPVTGLLSIAAYPRSYLGLATRDILLIVPLFVYVGLRRFEDRAVLPPFFPWGLFFAFAGLIGVQMFNPSGGSIISRLIGGKTWLFYVPLVLCAYDYCATVRRVHRLFKLICLAGIPSILIGLVEAVEIGTGHATQVYGYYGKAASAVSQGFAQLQVNGGGVIRRVPSTFSFGAQYYLFTLVMLSSALVWMRLSTSTRERHLAGLVAAFVCLAAVTSGVREALIGIPVLFLVDLMVSRRKHIAALVQLVGSGVTGVLALAAVAGSTAAALLSHLGQTAATEYEIVLVHGFTSAFKITVGGLGVGVDTNAARYALPATSFTQTLFAQGFESWYVKAELELGLIGLVLVCAFAVSLVGRLRSVIRHTGDARLASAGGALLALVVSILLQNLKGQYLDLDPMAMFFWVGIGVLLRFPMLAKNDGS